MHNTLSIQSCIVHLFSLLLNNIIFIVATLLLFVICFRKFYEDNIQVLV